MVDVHARVGATAQGDEIEELLESPSFIGVGVRPQRRVLLGVIDPAEEVVDAPLRRRARGGSLGVQRVALEVEEDVTAVGSRQRADRLREHDLVGRDRGFCRRGLGGSDTARGAGQLQPGLRAQTREGVPRHAVGGLPGIRQLVDRADAGGPQPVALHGAHARDEQQIAVRDHLGVARRAPPTRDDPQCAALVTPRDRGTPGPGRQVAVGDERAQPRAT